MCDSNQILDRDRLPTRFFPRSSAGRWVVAIAVFCAVVVSAAAEDPALKGVDGVALPGFLPHHEIPIGAGRDPSAVVLADLSGDGVPDLAVSVETADTFDDVDVALGVGDGTFGPFLSYGVGSVPNDIVVGDMNRDGHPDLVTANSGSNDVSVLINNGDGTFAPEDYTATGTFPVNCAVADVDNDGFLDIVSVNSVAQTVTVMTNDGSGVNYSSTSYGTTSGGTHGRNPFELTLADFDKDGYPDIATTSSDDEIVLMYNTGSGTFFSGDFAFYIPTGDNPVAIEAFDFDDDGWLDVVTSNAGVNSIYRHLNDRVQPFPSFAPGTPTAAASWPAEIGLGDHDLDGEVDLVVGLPSTDLVQLFLGDGSGGFVAGPSTPAGDWPSSVAVADLDRDGDLDVATANNNGNSVSILLNRFNILFGPPPVARIDAPTALECLCGSDGVTGVAHVDAGLLDHWTLEFRPVAVDTWNLLVDSTVDVPEPGGVLTTWDSSGLAEGRYLLKLTVHSQSGLSATDEVVVWVSRIFDVATFDFRWGNVGTPTVADFVAGNACPIGSVGDNGCGGISYTVDYTPSGGGSFNPIDPGMPSYSGGASNSLLGTWDTTGTAVPDGDYDVRLVGTNACGQQQTTIRSVSVDNTPPVAALTGPTSCTVFHPNDLVEIRGTASDANLVAWSLSVIGGPHANWHTLASGTSSVVNNLLASWDTTGLPECGYVLRLRVTDAAIPNCGDDRRSVTVYRALGLGVNGCMFSDGVEIGSTAHWDTTSSD